MQFNIGPLSVTRHGKAWTYCMKKYKLKTKCWQYVCTTFAWFFKGNLSMKFFALLKSLHCVDNALFTRHIYKPPSNSRFSSAFLSRVYQLIMVLITLAVMASAKGTWRFREQKNQEPGCLRGFEPAPWGENRHTLGGNPSPDTVKPLEKN